MTHTQIDNSLIRARGYDAAKAGLEIGANPHIITTMMNDAIMDQRNAWNGGHAYYHYQIKERAVIDQVIDMWEVDNGDAQGIVEARQHEVEQWIKQDLSAYQISKRL